MRLEVEIADATMESDVEVNGQRRSAEMGR